MCVRVFKNLKIQFVSCLLVRLTVEEKYFQKVCDFEDDNSVHLYTEFPGWG